MLVGKTVEYEELIILAGFRMETQILYCLSYLADERQASQVMLEVVGTPPANSGDAKEIRFDPWIGTIP